MFAFMHADLDPNAFFVSYSAYQYLSDSSSSFVFNQYKTTGMTDNICTQTIQVLSSVFDTTTISVTLASSDFDYKNYYYDRFLS